MMKKSRTPAGSLFVATGFNPGLKIIQNIARAIAEFQTEPQTPWRGKPNDDLSDLIQSKLEFTRNN